ncbi:MAG: D-aminoacyl-tRNA deacylase [Candidatus Methanomethylophilaceae archaeon]|nr:D-aminoacyl-tRNA deacylase [Candidatus Methanomethylophilaceae archaeon]MDD3379131.1 D-aminoacyl-tRNA deacylase [Candidatus Methanomethylophilaceae archaeon]MDY0224082.1 D-aminoacyl-tRNA deacylase [Candidatus Methanomethylophilaceae archaeon]
MSKLLICSEPDLPSVNMKNSLFSIMEWEVLDSDNYSRFYQHEDMVVLSTPDMHIYTDCIDELAEKHGIKVDNVIFMSKHSSASGEPALTVHPIGNYHENSLGGKIQTLVKPMPALMTDALRRIVRYNDMTEFQTCFEVTHHGPWLDKPTMFIEIGSDDRNWGNLHAAKILAYVLKDVKANDYPTIVGVGGGHYAPRFTEVALKYKVNFGHMLPNYQLDNRDDEDIVRMIKDACNVSDTKIVYIHKNSMKKPQEKHITSIIESCGFEHISSKDMELINEN